VTPLFFLLDWVWGVSVRASFLPRVELRVMYYVFCLVCAAVIQREPGAAPYVGLGESALNLFLLMLSILLPIWQLQDAVLSGGGGAFVPMTGWRVINVMLSGTMLVVSFQRNQDALVRRLRPGPHPHVR
jgi:hypothetical protein